MVCARGVAIHFSSRASGRSAAAMAASIETRYDCRLTVQPAKPNAASEGRLPCTWTRRGPENAPSAFTVYVPRSRAEYGHVYRAFRGQDHQAGQENQAMAAAS